AAFELFILKRENACKTYTDEQIDKAESLYSRLEPTGKKQLTETILRGLPGDEEMTLSKFRELLQEYNSISRNRLQQNLFYFLRQIIPVAEQAGVRMAIHPDDPPFSLFGLPRVVSTEADASALLKTVDSPYNGLTFCTGSYGARHDNDLPGMVERLSHRFNFILMRLVNRDVIV